MSTSSIALVIESPNPPPSLALLGRVAEELGMPLDSEMMTTPPRQRVPFTSRLPIDDLAWASVRAAGVFAGVTAMPEADRIASAYRSEALFTVDGVAPTVWSPLSGFFRAADGWIRTHGNYPHHAAALQRALGLQAGCDRDQVAATISAHTVSSAIASITEARGLAVPVLPETPSDDAARRRTPLLDVTRGETASARHGRHDPATAQISALPLTGIRVLDLTRVIAGPVCTRTLALLGADVLRVDPPHLPEVAWQHLDTGHGKRSAVLDATSPRFEELLADADVVVLGYRPASLSRLGLSHETIARKNPRAVVVQLSAWGSDEPDLAGFDSLVQAQSGIAMIESPDADRPGALPVQALDHSAGYLLAAAVSAILRRRTEEGGSWLVSTSLRRIAAELLGMPRRSDPATAAETALHTASFTVDGRIVTTAGPALPSLTFAPPHAWGSDQPRW